MSTQPISDEETDKLLKDILDALSWKPGCMCPKCAAINSAVCALQSRMKALEAAASPAPAGGEGK